MAKTQVLYFNLTSTFKKTFLCQGQRNLLFDITFVKLYFLYINQNNRRTQFCMGDGFETNNGMGLTSSVLI